MASQSTLITAIQPVRPGDLITAGFFNSLVSAIWELEDRLATLESEGTTGPPQPGGDGTPAPAALSLSFVGLSVGPKVATFEAFGTGLEPAGLKAFAINNKPIKIIKVEGDDDSIVFTTSAAAIPGAPGGQFSDSLRKAPEGPRAPSRITLTIQSNKGSRVTRAVTIEDEREKFLK